jgi:hypothetical protein
MRILHKYKRLFLITHLVFIISLSIFRLYFIINFFNWKLPFLIDRNHFTQTFPKNSSEFLKTFFSDPRWISNIVYMFLSFMVTLSILYFLFLKKKYIYIAIAIYGILTSIIVILVLLSLITHNYKIGYALAQDINQIIQSPVTVVFLIAAFYQAEKLKFN